MESSLCPHAVPGALGASVVKAVAVALRRPTIITGINVKASINDPPTDRTTASDKSRKSAAAKPLTNTIGPNTNSVVNVPAYSGPDTSSVASIALASSARPVSSRRLPTASATTIALSTSNPTPSASPPSESTFTVTSNSCRKTSAISTDNGRIAAIARLDRQSLRNSRIMSSESTPPSTISCPRFDSASTTKSACAATTSMRISGNSVSSCSITSRRPEVTATVLAPASL